MLNREPKMDHAAIVAALHRRGMTLSALASRNGISPKTMCRVKTVTNYKAQEAIAAFLGEKPEELWPSRYPKGKPRILDTVKYPPVASQKVTSNPDVRQVA